MEITDYKKLPGTGLRRAGFITLAANRSRLYLGADHLLSVDSLFGSETYKRFYFRDLQALVVRRTPGGAVATLVFGCLAALSALALFAGDPVTVGFGVVFTSLFSLFFLGFLIRLLGWGGTCRTWVQTAVQTEELPSLNQVKTCRNVLGRLQPLIQAAQPDLHSPAPAAPIEPATPSSTPSSKLSSDPSANP